MEKGVDWFKHFHMQYRNRRTLIMRPSPGDLASVADPQKYQITDIPVGKPIARSANEY